ncbi:hypothetical protein AHAS_Ahas16G0188600 [Arachis hypogaea]
MPEPSLIVQVCPLDSLRHGGVLAHDPWNSRVKGYPRLDGIPVKFHEAHVLLSLLISIWQIGFRQKLQNILYSLFSDQNLLSS